MPAQEIRSTVPQFAIKIDGQDLPQDAVHEILEASVESSLHLPDACTIRVHDAEFKWLDANLFAEGKEVMIQAGEGRDQLHTIFEGEIVSLEMDLAGMGVPTLTARCLDKAHRLHRGTFRRTFQQVTDSDLVTKIAHELQLRTDVDATSEVRPWVIQNNQTNWEFLSMLAERSNRRLFLEGKDKLSFKKVGDRPQKETELEWGKDLRSFRIRVESSPQVKEVVIRGWDPSRKEAIVGIARNAEGTAEIQEKSVGGDVGAKAFGASKKVIVDRPVHTQSEADQLAQSALDTIGAGFVEADGLCYAHPQLRPGQAVKLKNIGKRFNGKYLLTSTNHTWSPAEGLSTQFVISGKEPVTVTQMLSGHGDSLAGSGSGPASKNAGNIVVGIVVDNLDPEEKGRIKVKYPWLSEDDSSHWVRIATPMAGPGRGMMIIPEINDEVLVAFEHGDIHRAYMIGALWNGVDEPPIRSSDAVVGGKVERRHFRTRIGHTFDFDDRGTIRLRSVGGQKMYIIDGERIQFSYGSTDTLTGGAFMASPELVKVMDAANNHLTINLTDNSIEMMCLGDMSLQCMNFSLTALGEASITTGAAFSVTSAAEIGMEAGAALSTVSGVETSITSGADLSLTAAASIEATAGANIALTSGAAMEVAVGAALEIVAAANVSILTPTFIAPPPIPPVV